MKELEYPFDSSFLLQKRRKLKKALLADGSARMENALPCWAFHHQRHCFHAGTIPAELRHSAGVLPVGIRTVLAGCHVRCSGTGSISAGSDLYPHHKPQHHRSSAAHVRFRTGSTGRTGAAVHPLHPDVGTPRGNIPLPHFTEQL